VNVDLSSWRLEEREEYRVSLELLRDATMNRIISVDAHLISGIISEVEGDSGMGRGPSGVNKDFANNLIGIDADRVGAWLLPQSPWRRKYRGAVGTGTGWWGVKRWWVGRAKVIVG